MFNAIWHESLMTSGMCTNLVAIELIFTFSNRFLSSCPASKKDNVVLAWYRPYDCWIIVTDRLPRVKTRCSTPRDKYASWFFLFNVSLEFEDLLYCLTHALFLHSKCLVSLPKPDDFCALRLFVADSIPPVANCINRWPLRCCTNSADKRHWVSCSAFWFRSAGLFAARKCFSLIWLPRK